MKLNSISLAQSQTTSSSAPYDPRSPSPAHLHLQSQQQQMQTPQAHYLKLQPKSAIVSNSSNFSNVSTAPEANRKYKHSPFLPRRSADPNANADPLAYGSPKKESTLSSLGQSIFKNLTTSPFSHRKSEQKSYKPPLPGEDGGGGASIMNGNRTGFSNPSSPLMLNRKMIDLNDEQQYKHLQGNTSPIGEKCFVIADYCTESFIWFSFSVLQRFYHQQNQLRESKQLQLEQQQHLGNPFYKSLPQQQQQQQSGIPIKCSPIPSHRTVHHPTNPTTLTGGSVGYPQMVPPESSNIPTYQYQPLNTSTSSPKHKTGGFFNSFGRTKSQHNGSSSSGTSQRGERGSSTGSDSGYPDGGFYTNHHLYGRQTLPEYTSAGYAMQSGISNGDNMKDDTGGWWSGFR